MREIYGFLRLASRLANPFGHPSQVRTQVLVFQTCVDLRRLASSFGQGLKNCELSPSLFFYTTQLQINHLTLFCCVFVCFAFLQFELNKLCDLLRQEIAQTGFTEVLTFALVI